MDTPVEAKQVDAEADLGVHELSQQCLQGYDAPTFRVLCEAVGQLEVHLEDALVRNVAQHLHGEHVDAALLFAVHIGDTFAKYIVLQVPSSRAETSADVVLRIVRRVAVLSPSACCP